MHARKIEPQAGSTLNEETVRGALAQHQYKEALAPDDKRTQDAGAIYGTYLSREVDLFFDREAVFTLDQNLARRRTVRDDRNDWKSLNRPEWHPPCKL